MGWTQGVLKRCLGVLFLAAFAIGALTATADAESFIVQGQVLNPHGDPVLDARVDLTPLQTPYDEGVAILTGSEPRGASLDSTRTDSEGRFALTAPGWGLFRVVVEVPGYLPVAHRLAPLLGDASLATLTLTPDEGAVVDVRDAAGQAAAGARLVLRWRHGSGLDWDALHGWYEALRLRTTAADGAEVVPYVAGEHVDVAVYGVDQPPWTGQLTPEDAALEVTLPVGNRLQTVEVREGEGKSRQALVMRQGWPVALTDEEGHVQLSASEAPVDLLVLTRDGQQHSVSWRPGETTLSLDSPQWIPGRVVRATRASDRPDAAGVPAALVWDLYTLRQVEADAAGHFRWPSHGPKPTLRAAKPGFAAGAPPGTRVAERDASGAWRITLHGGMVLRGQVLDMDGRALAGVALEARSKTASSEGRRTTETDSKGYFRLDGLAAGRLYALRAEAVGYAPQQVDVEPGPPASSTELTLTLHPGPVLFGRAVDAALSPLEGVRVELFGIRRADGSRFIGDDGGERSAAPTFSDAEGRFEIRDVPPGLHTLALRAEGYAPRVLIAVPVDTAVGQNDVGDLELQHAVTQDLWVVDESGLPVPKARVRLTVSYPSNGLHGYPQALRDWVHQQAETDAEGRLRFRGLHPEFGLGLSIRHPSFIRQDFQVQPSNEVLEVTLESGATLRGRIVDSQGQGLRGARLTVHITPATREEALVEGTSLHDSGVSQDDGSFEIVAVKPGRARLKARLEGYQSSEVSLEIDSKDLVDGLTVELEPAAALELRGRVLGPDGEPVPFARVSVFPDDGAEGTVRPRGTQARYDGRFQIAPLDPGPVIVKAEDKLGRRTTQNLHLHAETAAVTLVLEPGQVLAGRVVDSEGQGVRGARVEFIGPGALPSLPVGEDGGFLVPLERGGPYTVIATRQDLGRTRVDVEVPEGDSLTDVELVLRPTGRIVGNILGLQTDDLPRLILRAQLQDPLKIASTITRIGSVDLEGGLVIEGIFPGLWRVLADIRGTARRVEQTVEVLSDGETASVDLDLGDPGLTLEGRILHNGLPAKEVWIDPGLVYTDSSGYFRLEGLPPGPYRLLLRGPWGRYAFEGEIYADHEVEIHVENLVLAGPSEP